jgi:DNA-directed RNA polymerases I, II, and III subunit RPABC1
MDFQEQNRLFKVRKTSLEMVTDRGITVPTQFDITFEEFKAQYDAKNIDIYIHDEEKDKKVYIYFYNETKSFGKNELKNLMARLLQTYEDENMIVILLLRDKENSMVTKELQKPIYANVEIFLQSRMTFNITHHILVPKHVLLNTDEENEILSKYNITKSKLPKLLKTDPVARYYGMKTDQICKILRHSAVSGFSVYYRVVK